MSLADLQREAARRYLDTMPIADWARGLLDRLGAGPTSALRAPARLKELEAIWRRVSEAELLERFTVAELAALARFYATPEGASIIRKTATFQDATTPALVEEVQRMGSGGRQTGPTDIICRRAGALTGSRVGD